MVVQSLRLNNSCLIQGTPGRGLVTAIQWVDRKWLSDGLLHISDIIEQVHLSLLFFFLKIMEFRSCMLVF